MRSDRVLWFVLASLGITAVLLMMNDETGTTLGFDNDDFAQFVYLGAIATLVGSTVFSRARVSGNLLPQIAIWLAIIVGLVIGYKLYQGEPIFMEENRPLPPSSRTGITASLMDGIDSRLHFARPFDLS